MPVPQSDTGQEVSGSEITTFPMDVKPQMGTEKEFGNKFAFVEFKDPQGARLSGIALP